MHGFIATHFRFKTILPKAEFQLSKENGYYTKANKYITKSTKVSPWLGIKVRWTFELHHGLWKVHTALLQNNKLLIILLKKTNMAVNHYFFCYNSLFISFRSAHSKVNVNLRWKLLLNNVLVKIKALSMIYSRIKKIPELESWICIWSKIYKWNRKSHFFFFIL